MIGNTIIKLDQVDSTNTYAGNLTATDTIADGTVIWALDQFAGRGQHDHKWNSAPGRNLTCTIYLRPRFLPPDQQFMLNKAMALGVSDFLMAWLRSGDSGTREQDITIKWPNDLYAGLKKIGGILIENKIQGAVFETSLVGIGININQETFPEDLPNPISLKNILGKEIPLEEALSVLCRSLDSRYKQLAANEYVKTDHDFNQQLLGYHQWRHFLAGQTVMEGKISGTDAFGRLIVENKERIRCHYNHQEIQYIL